MLQGMTRHPLPHLPSTLLLVGILALTPPSPLLGPEARIDIPSLRNLALGRATDDNPSLFDRL